ncbi:MAG: hypothetical protein NTU59_03405 [Coprothermobacterota bacterium]|nr:hypothetical protein [Coprothermobacterota bacterium]
MNRVEVARVDARIVRLQSTRDVQRLAPSPYGIDAVLWNGEQLTYHSLQKAGPARPLWKQRLENSRETEGLH